MKKLFSALSTDRNRSAPSDELVVNTGEVSIVCANESAVTQAYYSSVGSHKVHVVTTPAAERKLVDAPLQTPEGYNVVLAEEGLQSNATRVFFAQARYLRSPHNSAPPSPSGGPFGSAAAASEQTPRARQPSRSSSPPILGARASIGTRMMPGVGPRDLSPNPNFHRLEGFRPPIVDPFDARTNLPPKIPSEDYYYEE
eukprot:TRINITY_DN1491_c0_g1_i1.p1 TRINITY_DN1491_c0_g1~~TRINITY_DN1491_c0_g1_i1.p1  ORF type:complete len:198 (+),score=39.76 TRINITY_DN1491_c0_g1_i1:168-761(+)